MLAEGASSRYRQYKRYTAEFIAWLRKTPTADHSAATQPQTTKKPNKRKKKNSPKKELNDRSVQTNSITISQLLAFAKQASAKGHKLSAILYARVRRAISARREFALWFSKHQPDQAESNSRHSFFADVLEDILSLLEKEPSKVHRPVAKEDDSPSKTKPNSFSILECDDEFDEADATESDGSQSEETMSEIPPRNEPVIIDDVNSRDLQMEEAAFAASCFFRELGGIREHVQSLWQLYHKGKADLFTTSLTTNTALEMVRRSEDDFITRFPKYRDHKAWLDLFHQLVPKDEKDDGGQIWFDLKTVQSQLTRIYIHLAPSPLFMTARSAGWVERVDETIIPNLSNDDRFKEESKAESRTDLAYLVGLVADCEFISNKNVTAEMPVDVFTAGMGALIGGVPSRLETGGCGQPADGVGTLFHAFSTLVVLDIQKILRSAVDRSFEELQALAQSQLKTVRAYRDHFVAQDMPEEFDHFIDGRAAQLEDLIREWVLTDNTLDYKQTVVKAMAMHVKETEQPFYYLRNHPLICGIIGATVLAHCQAFAMAINESHLALNMVHLFSTVRTRLQQKAWPDLDAFIRQHENKGVLVDFEPRSPKDAERRIALNAGVSLVSYAKNRRDQQSKTAHKLNKDIDMSHTVFDTYKALWLREKCNLGVFDASMAMLHTKLKAKEKDRRTGRTSFDNLQLLARLQDELQLELPMFLFDYGKLEMVCLDLVRKLNAELLGTDKKGGKKTLDRVATIAKAHLKQVGSVVTNDRAVALSKFFKSKDNPSDALRNAASELAQKWNALSIRDSADDAKEK